MEAEKAVTLGTAGTQKRDSVMEDHLERLNQSLVSLQNSARRLSGIRDHFYGPVPEEEKNVDAPSAPGVIGNFSDSNDQLARLSAEIIDHVSALEGL